jgi:hypothetical protein
MTSRECVRAAIGHRATGRVPYCIKITADAWERLRPVAGGRSCEAFLDNDVRLIGPPWWRWQDLGPDWGGFDAPTSPPRCIGTGSYDAFIDTVKRTADETDKYILVTVYGSHFEKAYFSRGIENFLADLAGSPDFARRLLNTIIEKNLVMLENVLILPEIDGVLLGSDWGSQLDLLLSPAVW